MFVLKAIYPITSETVFKDIINVNFKMMGAIALHSYVANILNELSYVNMSAKG